MKKSPAFNSVLALGFILALVMAAGAFAATLKPAAGGSLPVDTRGFIHRWKLLEPMAVPGRLTEAAVQEALQANPLPASPAWHEVDTENYNVNLYHFAYGLKKPTSNVLFWVTTTVESPREITNARLAIGSNAASRWWLNDELVVALNDDRQAVIDDGVSRRLTLRKGRNVIRAAVINGGGATDFCARFLDAQDKPIQDLKVISQ